MWGYGNPGKEYEKTRHNLGFLVLDKVAEKFNVNIEKAKLNGIIGETRSGNEKILLVKPTTYMNLSGNCVVDILNFYKATSQDLIVIYDDIDIEVGKIKVKSSGSPGTHNGMRDITNKIGTKDFTRVRVGSGKPSNGQNLADYVLSNFRKEELVEIDSAIMNATEAVIEILKNGVNSAMNKFN